MATIRSSLNVRSSRLSSILPPSCFRSAQDGKDFFELAYGLREKRPNEEPGLIYSRLNTPDLEMLEDRLAIWDEAEGSLVFASGMAAISSTLWALFAPRHSDCPFRTGLWGNRIPIEEDTAAIRVTSIGFLTRAATRRWRKRSSPRAVRVRSSCFISKHQRTRPMGWWISNVSDKSCPAFAVSMGSGRSSSSTVRCWDRSIRRPWHMAPIWGWIAVAPLYCDRGGRAVKLKRASPTGRLLPCLRTRYFRQVD